MNSDLLDISQLYADFAEPYNLWECQLAILHCAGHPDNMLIETVWNNIIDGEMSRTVELPSNDRINIIANKIVNLGKLYSSSQKYFPLGNIRLPFYLSKQLPDWWVFMFQQLEWSCIKVFYLFYSHCRTHPEKIGAVVRPTKRSIRVGFQSCTGYRNNIAESAWSLQQVSINTKRPIFGRKGGCINDEFVK